MIKRNIIYLVNFVYFIKYVWIRPADFVYNTVYIEWNDDIEQCDMIYSQSGVSGPFQQIPIKYSHHIHEMV